MVNYDGEYVKRNWPVALIELRAAVNSRTDNRIDIIRGCEERDALFYLAKTYIIALVICRMDFTFLYV